MENLATIVFERTLAGADAIKTAGGAIPRQLRTLLLAIDGRSPVSQYVPFLTVLAPLSEKFAQLEMMGLARRRLPVTGGDALAPSLSAEPQKAHFSQQVSEAELRNFAGQMLSPFAPQQATPDPSDYANKLQILARSNYVNDAMDGGNHTARAPASSRTAEPPAQPALANLLAHMQAYLSHAAGMEGLPVALMLEQITSLAQLRRELPSYAELVMSYGGSPEAHLKTLTDLLEQAPA